MKSGLSFVVSPRKKHPDHPSRDPLRAVKEEKGRRMLAKKKFESDAQRRDYERAVNANPHNVMGMPAFYPPVEHKSFGGVGDGKPTEMLPCGHRWTRLRYVDDVKTHECPYGGIFAGTVEVQKCRKPQSKE